MKLLLAEVGNAVFNSAQRATSANRKRQPLFTAVVIVTALYAEESLATKSSL